MFSERHDNAQALPQVNELHNQESFAELPTDADLALINQLTNVPEYPLVGDDYFTASNVDTLVKVVGHDQIQTYLDELEVLATIYNKKAEVVLESILSGRGEMEYSSAIMNGFTSLLPLFPQHIDSDALEEKKPKKEVPQLPLPQKDFNQHQSANLQTNHDPLSNKDIMLLQKTGNAYGLFQYFEEITKYIPAENRATFEILINHLKVKKAKTTRFEKLSIFGVKLRILVVN